MLYKIVQILIAYFLEERNFITSKRNGHYTHKFKLLINRRLTYRSRGFFNSFVSINFRTSLYEKKTSVIIDKKNHSNAHY